MSFKQQNGFSLVELMVSLVIGSLIVIGVTTLFIQNQKTYNLQKNTRQIQQQGMFVLEHMVSDIRKTGYRFISSESDVGVMLEEAGGLANSEDGENDDSDRLTVAFDVNIDASVSSDVDKEKAPRDCEGKIIESDARIVQTYWLEDEGLRCKSSYSSSNDGLLLLEGVEDFQVLYGIDGNKDGIASVSHYVTADNIEDEGIGGLVVAIRIGYIVANVSGDGENSEQQDYYLLDKKLSLGGNGDKKVRRQFVRTIPLRNYNENEI